MLIEAEPYHDAPPSNNHENNGLKWFTPGEHLILTIFFYKKTFENIINLETLLKNPKTPKNNNSQQP